MQEAPPPRPAQHLPQAGRAHLKQLPSKYFPHIFSLLFPFFCSVQDFPGIAIMSDYFYGVCEVYQVSNTEGADVHCTIANTGCFIVAGAPPPLKVWKT